jgi:hypothetical protein
MKTSTAFYDCNGHSKSRATSRSDLMAVTVWVRPRSLGMSID